MNRPPLSKRANGHRFWATNRSWCARARALSPPCRCLKAMRRMPPQLVPLIDEVHQRTGVLPKWVSVDDGYASAQGRATLLEEGVEEVSISGSKGKQLIPEEEWNSELYQQLRRGRSAVESLIFVLKHCFAFGRLRRRGLEEVRAELLEKVIAYNFVRMGLVRQAQQETPLSKVA
ncbi:MAG: hypothetical protein CMJ50_10170 [Planctomycetaceae bacterium]|nr:hypothetical protein [Planctomycetaceae bacterium]